MTAKTKLATADQPRMLIKEPLEVEYRKFYTLHANIEAHGHMGSCPGYALHIYHVRMNSESESEELLREPWHEKPGWNHTRTESLGESDSERREELDLSEVQGDVLEEPRIKNDEQVAVPHVDAPGSYIIENQHEEKSERHPC